MKLTVSRYFAAFFCLSVLLGNFNAEANSLNAINSNKDFGKWLADFRQEAEQAGISKHTLDVALKGIRPLPAVLKLDKKQPEMVKTFQQYRKQVLNKKKIGRGKYNLEQNRDLLNEVSEKYKVPPQFIAALWGVETEYGKITGKFNVIQALATLAYDGRRSEFFRKELINALKIIDAKHISAKKMKGSWAGAMGQTQFMPTSYMQFAEDYDQDGKPDIWNSREDIFASIANYLAKSGWNPGQTWGYQVELPQGFDFSQADINVKKDVAEWKSLGVKLPDGHDLPDSLGKASIINLEDSKIIKKGGSYYLVFDNFRTLLKWNRSLYFATVVGLLSDKIK